MEKILTLTRKHIRNGLKKKWGLTTFCEKYDCNADELYERINHLYKYQKKIDEVVSEIKANEKKFDQHKQQAKSRKGTPLVIEDPNKAPLQNELETQVELVESPEDPTAIGTLNCLRADEERLSREVIQLEMLYEADAEKRRGRLKEMRGIKADIEQLEKALQEKCLAFKEAVEHADSLAEDMSTISSERRPKVERLQKIRAEIEELMTVSIAVYDSGEIAVLEAEEFTMDDSGYDELYSELLQSEECSELRVKDVRAMARLLSIARHSGRRLNLVCDHPEMEEVYQKLMA